MTVPVCRICTNVTTHWLGSHVVEKHNMDLDTYLTQFPDTLSVASDVLAHRCFATNTGGGRVHPPSLTDLTTKFVGLACQVNGDVDPEDCFPLPEFYRQPQFGALAEDVRAAAASLIRRRSTYIWGPAGSGKDAIVHALSHYTQTPAKLFQMEPGEDVRAWFFSHEFSKDGTEWVEGELLKALRDGYSSPISGRVIPYLILITDFDRATKEQAESMRLVMDSIQGRVKGPNGKMFRVMHGTQIVVTANSAGDGDTSGKYTASNVIDKSIVDRFERCYRFNWMDWRDEEIIVKNKFPLLVRRAPWAFEQVGKAVTILRAAISNDTFLADFSHRATCTWLGNAEDILSFIPLKTQVPKLLSLAFRAYGDRLQDAETRQAAYKLIDASLTGGAVDEGDTSHIAPTGTGRIR